MSFFRTTASRSIRVATTSSRALSTTPVVRKTVVDSAKETLDAVNKKVGQTLAGAIETGQQASASAKESLGETAEEAKQKGAETADVARKNANQTAAEARVKKDELLEKGKSS